MTQKRGRILSAVAGVVVAGTAAGAWGQTSSDLLLNAMPKDRKVEATASHSEYFKTEDESGDHTRFSRTDVLGRFRLAPDWKADPRVGFRMNYIDTNSESALVPNQLTDVALALGTGVAEFDGWVAGATVGIGYAAAGAFGDDNGIYGLGTFIVGKEFDDNTSFGLVLDYDGNRSILPDVPLPGFQYRQRLDQYNLVLALGFPFTAVTWEPNDVFRLELTWAIPDSFRIDLDYKFTERFSVFGALRDRTEAFKWDELDSKSDRVLLNQTVIELGLRWTAADTLSIVAAGGWAFKQDLRYGFDSRDSNELVELDDAPFLRAAVELRY